MSPLDAPTLVVVGTGRTAGPIAAALARVSGADVTVCGRNPDRARATAVVATELAGVPVRGRALDPDALAGAAVVLESIAEDLPAKRELLPTLQAWAPDDAVLATNTSSLPLRELAEVLDRPDRFAGLHFLHPAHATRVVEVIPAEHTDVAVVECLDDLVLRMGKRTIRLRRDIEGFVWNRLQFAMLRECLHLLDEGVADVESIDAAVADGLAPRWMACGPFASADLCGLGTFARVSAELMPVLAASEVPSASLLSRAAANEGFYAWAPELVRRFEEFRAEVLGQGAAVTEARAAVMPRAAP
jgi:3-hydroxybutyryl-CoA dehydrogenase